MFPTLTAMNMLLGSAIHGPMPVSVETFDEVPGPLVHIDVSESNANWIGPYEPPLKFIWTNGPPSLSESSRLHWHRSIECSSLRCSSCSLTFQNFEDVHETQATRQTESHVGVLWCAQEALPLPTSTGTAHARFTEMHPGRNYMPLPPPISGPKAFFRGGGWGCIF